MRKKMFFVSLMVMMVVLGILPPAAAQDAQTPLEPAHLVLSVTGSGARINRMDWDLNAFAPVFPGASVRASDYIDLSGRTTVLVLCTDLALLDQRGSEVPRCNTYPSLTAFYYVDDPTWSAPASGLAVMTLPADLASVPAEVVNPSAYRQKELAGGDLEAVLAGVNTINGLNLSAEARAFALSSLYRSQQVYFEALGALTALPDLGCTARRPTVAPPGGEDRPLVQSPITYLRVGELYELFGQTEDAIRSYRCAAELAQAVDDPADMALAYARWANVTPDPVEAVQFYQVAIDNYAGLGAVDQANSLLEICGSRNCTLP